MNVFVEIKKKEKKYLILQNNLEQPSRIIYSKFFYKITDLSF